MERESFEDEEVAKLLNEHYVAIKVDREERPDIDHIYMSVCQALTGHGGWPLTVFLTPDQKPFFAGTYFPKTRRYGHPGLIDLLTQIAEKWRESPDEIERTGENILEHIEHRQTFGQQTKPDSSVLDEAESIFEETFDARYGGFGSAPKFPSPHNLMFLLRYGSYHQDDAAIEMVTETLDAMYRGGIFDHVGFGFARYSVDEKWLVPHFEKMLYDNALLAMAYIEAYQLTGEHRYADVARDIFTYVLRDMTSPEGGFYSAEDADSEGEEGKFYLWTPSEIKAVLGPELGERYCQLYDITTHGNFEGKSIPNLIRQSVEEYATKEGLSIAEWREQVRELNHRLFLEREKRVHPHKDDKILTAWNGLMIAALAKAGRALAESSYTEAAARAVSFVRNRLMNEEGRLLARYRDGEAAYLGYVDDYAFFIWALIEMYETTFATEYLELAVRLQNEMIRLFWDEANGGFFMYGIDAEKLITRPKEVYDGAMPSGNSVAALNLLRLARMTGDPNIDEIASRHLEALMGETTRYPAGYSFLLLALSFALYPSREVVIAGDESKPETQSLIQRIQQLYLPDTVLLFHSSGPSRDVMERLAPYIRTQTSIDGKPTVYICENFACKAPITDVDEILAALTDK
jgi:uncharacterized protein YyaL (SSP411 family)